MVRCVKGGFPCAFADDGRAVFDGGVDGYGLAGIVGGLVVAFHLEEHAGADGVAKIGLESEGVVDGSRVETCYEVVGAVGEDAVIDFGDSEFGLLCSEVDVVDIGYAACRCCGGGVILRGPEIDGYEVKPCAEYAGLCDKAVFLVVVTLGIGHFFSHDVAVHDVFVDFTIAAVILAEGDAVDRFVAENECIFDGVFHGIHLGGSLVVGEYVAGEHLVVEVPVIYTPLAVEDGPEVVDGVEGGESTGSDVEFVVTRGEDSEQSQE